jgi:hypothetical protein
MGAWADSRGRTIRPPEMDLERRSDPATVRGPIASVTNLPDLTGRPWFSTVRHRGSLVGRTRHGETWT